MCWWYLPIKEIYLGHASGKLHNISHCTAVNKPAWLWHLHVARRSHDHSIRSNGIFYFATQWCQHRYYNTLTSGIVSLFREGGNRLNLAWNLHWLLDLEKHLRQTQQRLPVRFHLWHYTNTDLNPELTSSQLSLRHHLPRGQPFSPGWRCYHGNHSDAYIQYFAMSSITPFYPEKYSDRPAAASQKVSPAGCFDLTLSAPNSANFTKHMTPASSFHLKRETKQKPMG